MLLKILGKRKNFIINPSFQWTLIRWSLLLSLLTSLIYLTSNLLFFKQLKQMGAEYNLPADSAYFRFIAEQEMRMHIVFVISTILAFILITGFGVWVSHRIAGPIYRMCKHLGSMKNGQKLKLNFRRNDFFPELASAFNEFQNRE